MLFSLEKFVILSTKPEFDMSGEAEHYQIVRKRKLNMQPRVAGAFCL